MINCQAFGIEVMKQAAVKIGIEKIIKEVEVNLDDNKTQIELYDNKDNAIETLQQIEDDWFAQQRTRFENNTLASRERNSNCYSFMLLKDSLFKKRQLKDILRLYLPKFSKFLKKKMRNFVIWLIEYILKVEKR
jgi:hypothetical protein